MVGYGGQGAPLVGMARGDVGELGMPSTLTQTLLELGHEHRLVLNGDERVELQHRLLHHHLQRLDKVEASDVELLTEDAVNVLMGLENEEVVLAHHHA